MSKIVDKPNTERVLCKYEFSPEEKAQIAQDMAEAIAEKDRLEDRLKAITSEFKGKIKVQEAAYRVASNQVKNGYEMREVECTVELYPSQHIAIYIRADTLQEVKRRPMNADEYQLKLA